MSVNGKLTLVNAAGSELGCDEPGELVWRLCDGDASVGEIVDLLSQSFSVAPGQMRRDVLNCLFSFACADLIRGK